MKVQDLIQTALRKIGATGHGRIQSASVLTDGLAALNAMLDAWGAERLTMFTSTRSLFDLTAGKGQYTLGPSGADWTAPRPSYLESAGLLLAANDPEEYELPLELLRTEQEWAAVALKGFSSLPTSLYYQPDYPNGTVILWPTPTEQARQVALYTPTAVSQFASLTDPVSLPPGYARALPYCLALELVTEFGKEPSPLLVKLAAEAKATIENLNIESPIAAIDPAVLPLPSERGGRVPYGWIGNYNQ